MKLNHIHHPQPERVQLLVLAAAVAHGGGVEGAQRRPHPETALRRQTFPAETLEEGKCIYLCMHMFV